MSDHTLCTYDQNNITSGKTLHIYMRPLQYEQSTNSQV